MKKLASLIVLMVLTAVLLHGCGFGNSNSSGMLETPPALSFTEQQPSGAEIAMLVTGGRKEEDQLQSLWRTINKFAGENGFTSGQYQTDDESQEAAEATLELAVKGGARLVVIPGREMALMLERAQRKYPDLKFVFVDSMGQMKPESNSTAVEYSFVEAGWLIGYTAVYEKMTGVAALLTGYGPDEEMTLGALLGAQAAAEEMMLAQGQVSFWQLENTSGLLEEWGQDIEKATARGVQLVLSSLDPELQEVNKALKPSLVKTAVFTSDINGRQEQVFSRVVGDLSPALLDVLEQWKADRFPDGQVVWARVQNKGIQLDLENSDFSVFTRRRYENAVQLLSTPEMIKTLEELLFLEGHREPPALASVNHSLISLKTLEESASSAAGGKLPAASEAASSGGGNPVHSSAPGSQTQPEIPLSGSAPAESSAAGEAAGEGVQGAEDEQAAA